MGATDTVTIVRDRLARNFEKQAGLRVLPLPFATCPLDISQFWASVQNSDSAHRWLHDQLVEAAREL